MSTEERTRSEEVGTESSIDANDEYHGAEATRVLRSAETDELTGRRLQAKLLPYGDPCRDHVVPFAGIIVGRDSDGRVRIRAGGAVRFAMPKRLKDVHLGPEIDRGDGPIPDGGQVERSEAYACSNCDQFRLSKAYTGHPDAKGAQEYEQMDLPALIDTCPACGGDVVPEGSR